MGTYVLGFVSILRLLFDFRLSCVQAEQMRIERQYIWANVRECPTVNTIVVRGRQVINSAAIGLSTRTYLWGASP